MLVVPGVKTVSPRMRDAPRLADKVEYRIVVPNQIQIKTLERELRELTHRRHEKENAARWEEQSRRKAPPRGERQPPNVVAESALYALFLKHRAEDCDGLDAHELGALLAELGVLAEVAEGERETACASWLSALDTGANGTVEWKELCAWWLKSRGEYRMAVRSPAELAAARLRSQSQWMSRQATPRQRTVRAPPPLPPPAMPLQAWETPYALHGVRPFVRPPAPTLPRKNTSTLAERRAALSRRSAPEVSATAEAQRPASAPVAPTARRVAPRLPTATARRALMRDPYWRPKETEPEPAAPPPAPAPTVGFGFNFSIYR
jgi:hypothetical protein